MPKRKLSQESFATAGSAARGGPQRGKLSAKVNAARFGRTNRGPVSPERLGGGSRLKGKLAK
jgi:hypothetical protein